jgi:NAD(P)-dependent dehydrogenase (short-subunit alcohol dehydrogenase family)
VKRFPGFGVYSASKAALRSLARTWLNELKGRKIRLNLLSPGADGHIGFPTSRQGDEGDVRILILRGEMGRPYRADCLAADASSH